MTHSAPMPVLFTLPNLEGGGAERVMVTLLRHLDRTRFAPRLALVEARGPFLPEVPQDVPVIDLGGRGVGAFVRLLAEIRAQQPAVVFSSVTFYNTLILHLSRWMPDGTRVIVRENTVPQIHIPNQPYGWLRWRLYGPALKRAHRIVCQSTEMADAVADCGAPKERLVCIGNPLDMEAAQTKAQATAREWGAGRHLLAVGRLVPAKGFDLLLEAFAAVSERCPDVTLHLLGEGPEEPRLREQAAALGLTGKVDFAGFTDNPYPYYKQADCLVIPSRYEGFPNVALEAMAVGTPVVAFDFPGGSPVVSGVNGWRVAAGDVAVLAERLQLVLTTTSLPTDGVRQSVADHSVAHITQQFERLFAEQ